MDHKSLELLEFPKIKEIVAGFASFSASRELALELQPVPEEMRISMLLKLSSEARRLLATVSDFTIGGVFDIREEVKLAARGKMLDPSTLLQIQHTLNAIGQLRRNLGKLTNDFPLLWNIAAGITLLNQLEKEIADCVTPTGELLDSASPRLANVRRRLRESRERLLTRLETTIRSPRGKKIVQESIITEREGRYVIPVKAEAQKEIKGIVHDVSNTGATVFIEPFTTVELGNELRSLVSEERREVERILKELSAKVGVHETEICRDIELVAELDFALAKARFAQKFRAAEPQLVTLGIQQDGKDHPAMLKLVNARHPLLKEKAVPLSVELGGDFSILIITGPNTGGKTVALKTIGLLSLMAQSGLPIPAAPESCIPVFDSVFADIGDEQSIESTLSTFSWHIGNINRIIGSATGKSLVLLDELGTSTDPTEGSALARAILLDFLNRKTLTAATSHFTELKLFAHTTPGIQNASLDVDPVTNMPTYHLTLGTPGGSNAIATASRLGLPPEIIDSARKMLSEGAQKLEALLADLTIERQKLEDLRHDLELANARAAQHEKELETERQKLKAEQRKVLQEARDRVIAEVADLQKEIRQAQADLRKEKTRDKIEQARKSLTAVREQLKSETWQPVIEAEAAEGVDESRIAVGDTVWLRDANLHGKVLSISEETQQVEVQAGQTRIKLGLESVEKSTPSAATSASRPEFAPTRRVTVERRAVPMELDLRGKRADEVTYALESYLNDASLANMREVRIIHGIATGTVRMIVRDYLASHPLVKSFRSGGKGEGGDGATVVSL